MIAKMLGNGPIMGVIRDFIYINQLNPPKKDIQILGTDIQIKPDDMNGAYDIEIDIGVSPAERQAMANQVDLLIQFATQAGLQMGLMDRVHLLRAMKKKYKYLGTKVDDLMKTEQQIIQEEQQKAQEPPQQKDWKEFVQMDKLFIYMTPMEQYQIIQQLGLKPDPRRTGMEPTALSGEKPSDMMKAGSLSKPQEGKLPTEQLTPMDIIQRGSRAYTRGLTAPS
jgi:hypothetical protein